ncbi:MAG: hypothetical protein U0325_18300 [Polyangiales bacterium]
MSTLAATLDALQETYLSLHTPKEDLFWAAKMGLSDDPAAAQRAHSEAEIAMNRFLQDPARLATLRAIPATEGTAAQRRILDGWVALFSAHTVESPAARALSEEIVQREGELQHARAKMPLGYIDPDTGALVPASSNKLALMMRNDSDPRRREAAYQGLRSVEPFVLEGGFLEIVRRRSTPVACSATRTTTPGAWRWWSG